MKTGVLHARIAEIVEELHTVNSQHHGQRIGLPSLPALGYTGLIRSSRRCQGIRPSIRSRNSSRRVLRFLPWKSSSANVGWSITTYPQQASAYPTVLCHIAADLFRRFLTSSTRIISLSDGIGESMYPVQPSQFYACQGRRFIDTGLVAVFDGRRYLSELGMRRAANMSRVLPSVIRSRHGAYLDRWYREHEQHHNDGVNRLVVRFAGEGVQAVDGWRGEMNVPGLTQVRPDLLVQVREGALGPGVYSIEFERRAVLPRQVEHKLDPYRRMAASGRPLPLLMVCETVQGLRNFRNVAGTLPMLTDTLERALAGPVTGVVTVWSRKGIPAALHCR